MSDRFRLADCVAQFFLFLNRQSAIRFVIGGGIFCAILALSACGGTATPYLPPTAPVLGGFSPPATPLPSPTLPTFNLLTLAPPCTFALTFIEDITIPDGTFVTPGEKLDKRWRVENSGSCNWDDTTRVKLLNGPALDAPLEQALYPARSGAQAIIRMTFTAPLEPGVYRSAWQAVDPTGNPFGEIFFVEIGVAAP